METSLHILLLGQEVLGLILLKLVQEVLSLGVLHLLVLFSPSKVVNMKLLILGGPSSLHLPLVMGDFHHILEVFDALL